MYRLRELAKKDLCRINEWRNNPQLIKLLGAPFRYIDVQIDERWYDNYLSNRNTAIRCSIVDENDEILGLVSLLDIDRLNQCAEFNIMIGDTENQGKGIGSFALKEMLHHAFYDMNLQRIELTVLDDNARAKHVYEKNGFVYEGRKRKSVFKDGRFVDMLMYSVLREEYSF
ncbi:MAG: GNAT family N-acetyltransferase [Clostridia bacterium]|nr:GNAT family N-acetyltransferase [Clostridia bacterium]